MSELAFESLSLALESTRGTAVTPPTHIINAKGVLTPMEEVFRPDDQLGLLAEFAREEIVRKWGEWSAEGAADVTKLPVLLNMAVAPVTSGAAPGRPVATIAVGAGGSLYTSATVAISGGGGAGATATATVGGGAVTAITVTNGGYYYTSVPTVTISGDGSGATATATLVAAPSTAKLWTFTRVMTADTLKMATIYWGDPNQRMYQGAYGFLDTITISGDASGTDDVGMTLAGTTQFPTDLSAPTLPSIVVGPLLIPGRMQLWVDATTIGTTPVTGRLVSAELTVPTGIVPKYVATGPAGGVTYDHVGRVKTHPELKLVLEMVDQTEYNLFKNGTDLKVRIRWNGGNIETSFYYYVEADLYGKFTSPNWGELESANRTLELSIVGNYNSGPASDLVMRVMNASASL